ncbi:hypothetical protein TNCV_2627531 [Trichonephila clavipes]|uniref:Reverse transcriptase domain-containing protein n=1 Tax=Trichonephila clavipes TaxID=2585209 RepID=A0A8X7BFT0_TRICX|nr:hypothetical protein TNCV_2627531 [Trichonephila clavipes]
MKQIPMMLRKRNSSCYPIIKDHKLWWEEVSKVQNVCGVQNDAGNSAQNTAVRNANDQLLQSRFISGLRNDIRRFVLSRDPLNLDKSINAALIEEQNMKLNQIASEERSGLSSAQTENPVLSALADRLEEINLRVGRLQEVSSVTARKSGGNSFNRRENVFKCFYCVIQGHRQAECRKKQRDERAAHYQPSPGEMPLAIFLFHVTPVSMGDMSISENQLFARITQPPDFGKLNEITLTQDFVTTTLDDILHEISGSNYFSALDMKSAFNQIPLHFADRHKTAFSTPDGDKYEFNRLCFCLKNSPKAFQSIAQEVLGDLLHNGALVYIDDIILFTKTIDEHFELLGKEIYQEFLAKRALPLTNLLRKDTPFEWTSETQEAFDDIKKAILNPPVLALPDQNAELQITTDASSRGIGAVLEQKYPNSESHGYSQRHISSYSAHVNGRVEKTQSIASQYPGINFTKHKRLG